MVTIFRSESSDNVEKVNTVVIAYHNKARDNGVGRLN